jgi:hypothetical protein
MSSAVVAGLLVTTITVANWTAVCLLFPPPNRDKEMALGKVKALSDSELQDVHSCALKTLTDLEESGQNKRIKVTACVGVSNL